MSKVNWESFFENSSTTEALLEFASGASYNKAFQSFVKPQYSKDIVKQIKAIKQDGISKSRSNARRAITRDGGWDWRDFKDCVC